MRRNEEALVRCHRCKVMTLGEALSLRDRAVDVRAFGYEDLVDYAGLIRPCQIHLDWFPPRVRPLSR